MDVTPMIPGDRWVIDGYGQNFFRLSGQIYEGPMLVFPTAIVSWSVTSIDDVSTEIVEEAVSQSPADLEVLLLGCGAKMTLLPRKVREAVVDRGISVDVMDTGAACRTYNVLMAEGRRVGAALIPV